MTIESMCAEAHKAVTQHVNRSAGQHLRAMKGAPPIAPTSADIYAMCMESDAADQFARWLCAAAGVAYPPVND